MNSKAIHQKTSPISNESSLALRTTLERGLSYLTAQQQSDGCWEGEMIWCPMITAQYIMTAHLTNQPIPQDKRDGFLHYFAIWQKEDGSWGLHDESDGYMFVTTLVYVALRLLDQQADEPMVARARDWLRKRGGVTGIPTWGKVWLSLMNLYGWEGVNPILPELWLLPDNNPIHPRRYYCHTRMIYLGIGVLQAQRIQAPLTPLLTAIREELYLQPYENISFKQHRNHLHKEDIYDWPGWLTKMGYLVSGWVDALAPKRLRQRAIRTCIKQIKFELQATQYACISPVNGLLNVLALWHNDPSDPDFHEAFARLEHWLWADPEGGHRYTGARSQTWDTGFVVQALCAGTTTEPHTETLRGALRYFDAHQWTTELENRHDGYRLSVLGGYCFSDKYHRWPVSDCTAEALSAMHLIHQATDEALPGHRLDDAARFILLRQNDDGGWGSYEHRRGNWFLERLNPSEMYGNCMLEHSYIECTASCLHGLASYLKLPGIAEHDATLPQHIKDAMAQGERFLRLAQQPDGSWPGFWGVNYTYGTLFGILGLKAAGVSHDDFALKQAVKWLKAHQLQDGGWGESWKSCLDETYIASPSSQVIQTSWAIMALILAGERDAAVLEPAIKVLQDRQMEDGNWPREGAGGVFFNTSMLHYDMYRTYFPIWALQLAETTNATNKLP